MSPAQAKTPPTSNRQIAATVAEIQALVEDLYVAAAELAIITHAERGSHD